VYLTGPHDGAPFGLSIVTHAVAGPFNLGLVVVRARIEVSRHDSTLTVTPDEDGPHAIPQIVFGVPLRLKRITVDIDRPDFMFNSTIAVAFARGRPPGRPPTAKIVRVWRGRRPGAARVQRAIAIHVTGQLGARLKSPIAERFVHRNAIGSSINA
jgi:hypothetical protein